MGQVNKVISAFLLLAVAVFVLWLMLTKTQSMRQFFTGKTPLTQMFSKDKPKEGVLIPTTTQKPENQSDFAARVQESFGSKTKREVGTKGGGAVLAVTQPPKIVSQPPKASNYPKTGAETMFLPLSLLIFAAGKFVLKSTETK